MKYIIYLLLSLCTSLAVFAQEGSRKVVILDDFKVLIDTTDQLNIEEVANLLRNGAFESVKSKTVNFAIDEPTVWISFQNNDDELRYLSPGNETNIWEASLFVKDSTDNFYQVFHYDHLTDETLGNRLNFGTLAIELPKGEKDILIRIFSRQNRSYRIL